MDRIDSMIALEILCDHNLRSQLPLYTTHAVKENGLFTYILRATERRNEIGFMIRYYGYTDAFARRIDIRNITDDLLLNNIQSIYNIHTIRGFQCICLITFNILNYLKI